MPFIPEIELKSPDEQHSFQQSKLKQAILYLQDRSPFYQKLFKGIHFDANDFNVESHWQHIPTTSKEDIQQHNWNFLCVPKNQIREYTATSGTFGEPVTIALTEKDLQRLAYNEYLSLECMEATRDSIFQLMLTLDKQFMAGMAYYSGIQRLGAALIRTGPGLPDMQLRMMQQLQPDVLVAVPSFLLNIIHKAAINKLDLSSLNVKKVLAIGESILDENLLPNNLSQKITSEWDIELFGTYASTEMQTAFTECKYHKGGHHHPELIFIELLDDEGNRVDDNELGEVTITTFGVEAMPVLRYRTGDICRAYDEPCECGRKTMRLGPVLGRKNQMVKLKGTTIFPSAIFDILSQHFYADTFLVEATQNEYHQDEITIYITDNYTNEHLAIAKSLLQDKLRVTPKIEFLSVEIMHQKQFPDGNRKPVRFIDNRKKW